VWDLFYKADKVRELMTRKIQEESLRTYLFTYSKVYDSISVVSLRKILLQILPAEAAVKLSFLWYFSSPI